MNDDGLYYYPGERIRVGDTVKTPHTTATIMALVAPGQEWEGEVWPEGLIVIEETWGERTSSVMFEPYTVGWEDLEFVKRAQTS